MPFKWSIESEREMLLFVVADIQGSSISWSSVAERMGAGLNANAVSQKFHKLRRENARLAADAAAPTTPTTGNIMKEKTPGSKSAGHKRKLADENETVEPTPIKQRKKKSQTATKVDDKVDFKYIASISDEDKVGVEKLGKCE